MNIFGLPALIWQNDSSASSYISCGAKTAPSLCSSHLQTSSTTPRSGACWTGSSEGTLLDELDSVIAPPKLVRSNKDSWTFKCSIAYSELLFTAEIEVVGEGEVTMTDDEFVGIADPVLVDMPRVSPSTRSTWRSRCSCWMTWTTRTQTLFKPRLDLANRMRESGLGAEAAGG